MPNGEGEPVEIPGIGGYVDHQIHRLESIGMERHILRFTADDEGNSSKTIKLMGSIVRLVVVPGKKSTAGFDITLTDSLEFDILENQLLNAQNPYIVNQTFVWDSPSEARSSEEAADEKLLFRAFSMTPGDDNILIIETVKNPLLTRA